MILLISIIIKQQGIMSSEDIEHIVLDNIRDRLSSYLTSIENGKARKIDYSNKSEQIKEYKWTRDEYSQYVFNPSSLEEIKNIKPRIIFIIKSSELPKPYDVNNKLHLYQTDEFWNKMIIHTSSIHTKNNRPGRQIKYFIIDENTEKIIGILSISSDILSIKARDDYIGLNTLDMRKQNIHYIFNLTTCVGVQPFSYNSCLGKLLARSVFSQEVQNEIKSRYGFYSLGFTTFSIYGRSVQYERIKEYKYLGLTKGSFFIIPEELYLEIKEYMKDFYSDYYNDVKTNSRAKQKIIMTMIELCGFKIKDFYHKIQRGIYFGFSDKRSKELIVDKNLSSKISDFVPGTMISIKDIYEQWTERWAKQRVNHLKAERRFRTKISWSVLDKIEKQRIYNKTHKEKKIVEMGKEKYQETERERLKKYKKRAETKPWKTETGIAKINELKQNGVKYADIVEQLKDEMDGLTIDIVKKIKFMN